MRFRYDFTVNLWPSPGDVEQADTAIRAVLPSDPGTVVGWSKANSALTIEFDTGSRDALEGLAVCVQALNNAGVYVDGWPHQAIRPAAASAAVRDVPRAERHASVVAVTPA